MSRDINTDKLYNARHKPVCTWAFRFLNQINADHREECGIGLALVLMRVCEKWGIDFREFIKVAEKIYESKRAEEPQIRAIDQYVKEEL